MATTSIDVVTNEGESHCLSFQDERLIGDCSSYSLGLVNGKGFISSFSKNEILAMLSYHYCNDETRWVKIVGTYSASSSSATRSFFNKMNDDEIEVLDWVGDENFYISVVRVDPLDDQPLHIRDFLVSFTSKVNGNVEETL